jgi:hypothetical protein
MPNRFLLTACAALILCSITSAQDAGEISLQFVSFPKSLDTQPVELVVGDGKTIPVDIPTNKLSPAYKVPKLSKWVLGKTVPGKDGEEIFEVYGEGRAAAAADQLVLVERSGAADSDGLTLTAFDAGADGFSGGCYLFLNTSKLDIEAEVGDAKFALKPLSHKLVHPEPTKTEGEMKYLDIRLHFLKGEKSIPFYSSRWRFNEKARSIVFYYNDPRNNQLGTHTIRDYLP